MNNCIIAQSGGPTAVINSSACGVIQAALSSVMIDRVFGAHNGILGVLNEDLFDLSKEDPAVIEAMRTTPAAALGSCRYKIKNEEDYQRIVDVFRKYEVGYFFYIGGNDSMDTADKVEKLAKAQGFPLVCIGVPKTIDNDLACTDHCPGYGSVIKYLATVVMEAGRDTEALYTTDTVNIIETMGRNTGWIAAGTALAKRTAEDAPHIILLPEVPFDEESFCTRVRYFLDNLGRCVIVVSEGTQYADGTYIAEQKGEFASDSFGHVQLGGAATVIKHIVENSVGVKARFSIPSTIQRAGAHWASSVDANEAYAVGKQAVKLAEAGISGVMVTLGRTDTDQPQTILGTAALSDVANGEKLFPKEWISEDGFFVTKQFIEYAKPLIQGESIPKMEDGLPVFMRFKRHPLGLEA